MNVILIRRNSAMYRRFSARPTHWSEVERLQRDMNRFLESWSERKQPAPAFPAMNIWTGADHAVITAELPGLAVDDINISVAGETLTLSGERKPEEQGEGTRYHRRERGFGKFNRTIELPFRVDPEKVDAQFMRGVLEIQLPRAESDKPKKITVRTAHQANGQ
jgi:HSP20 family protein